MEQEKKEERKISWKLKALSTDELLVFDENGYAHAISFSWKKEIIQMSGLPKPFSGELRRKKVKRCPPLLKWRFFRGKRVIWTEDGIWIIETRPSRPMDVKKLTLDIQVKDIVFDYKANITHILDSEGNLYSLEGDEISSAVPSLVETGVTSVYGSRNLLLVNKSTSTLIYFEGEFLELPLKDMAKGRVKQIYPSGAMHVIITEDCDVYVLYGDAFEYERDKGKGVIFWYDPEVIMDLPRREIKEGAYLTFLPDLRIKKVVGNTDLTLYIMEGDTLSIHKRGFVEPSLNQGNFVDVTYRNSKFYLLDADGKLCMYSTFYCDRPGYVYKLQTNDILSFDPPSKKMVKSARGWKE